MNAENPRQSALDKRQKTCETGRMLPCPGCGTWVYVAVRCRWCGAALLKRRGLDAGSTLRGVLRVLWKGVL